MSVPKSEQNEGKLKVLDLSKRLLNHTLNKCKNQTLFPKRQRWIICDRIINNCIDAQVSVRKANSVLVQQKEDYTYRRQEQNKAHACLNAVYCLLETMYDNYELPANELEYWSSLVKETDDTLKAWMASDKQRYKALLS